MVCINIRLMTSLLCSVRPKHRGPGKRGFSLLEMMIVMAAMSTVLAMGIVQFGNTTKAVKSTKLQQDVAALNRAVNTYAMSGGDLSTVSSGDKAIARLKTVASASQRTKIAGLRGSMVDRRLTGIASSSGDQPRAVWNDSKKTFFIQNTGAGFSEFVLDDTVTGPAQEDTRAMTMSLDNKDKWIWKFADSSSAPVKADMATGAPTTQSAPVAPSDPILLQLAAPVFSLPGGDHPLKNFDLSLVLTNSNPTGSSEILYSIAGGPFQRYSQPLVVPINTQVSAFVDSLNLDVWSDSPLISHNYTLQPVGLKLEFAVPKTAVTYQEMGGRMIAGTTPMPAPLAGGRATLSNASDLPDKYANDSVFTVRWTYDGSDPLRSAGAATGSPFSGGFPGQNIATSFDYWGTKTSLQVLVAAKALNTTLVASSPIAGATLTALPVTLRRPLITMDPATGKAVLALDTQYSDMPEGARIGYTTDGKDPPNMLNPADKGLYTLPFLSPGDTNIMARVYPPEGREAWFSPSSSASLRTPPITKLQSPVIALSNPKFDQNVNTITVALTNPNPTGSSQLYYAIKQPTDAFPPLTAFLPYTGFLTASSSIYPNGFQVQSYAKTLLPLNYYDSDAAEAATTPDFFGVALEGDVLLVIDASGSMSARFANTNRFDRVVTEAIKAINSLKPTQRFDVITFSNIAHWTDGSKQLKLATEANKRAAINALLQLKNYGGTDYQIGLKYALSLAPTRPQQIVFLSDGNPNFNNYLDEVATLANFKIKIDTIGIGHVEMQTKLREMASLTGGGYRFVVEPGSLGTFSPPGFSVKGDSLSYDKFPISLVLTNPNLSKASYISYSLNGGPPTVYKAPIQVPYDSTVEATVESTDIAWSPSVEVSQTYITRTFTAAKPVIKFTANTFTDLNPTITMTLENQSPDALTSLIWWFENETESKARDYTGPVVIDSTLWQNYASSSVKEVAIFTRAIPKVGFVYKGDTANADIFNQTTAFLAIFNKPPLLRTKFSLAGGSYTYDKFPMSLTLENPNGLAGDLMVAINGTNSFSSYTGPLSISYNSVIHSFVKPKPGDQVWRESPVTVQTYTPADFQLATPILQKTATQFTSTVKTITVTLTNPNSSSLSKLIYWFEGQDPSTKAVKYTGPINLVAADWETYVINGRTEAKLIVQAVGTESFAKPSSLVSLKLTNTN